MMEILWEVCLPSTNHLKSSSNQKCVLLNVTSIQRLSNIVQTDTFLDIHLLKSEFKMCLYKKGGWPELD